MLYIHNHESPVFLRGLVPIVAGLPSPYSIVYGHDPIHSFINSMLIIDGHADLYRDMGLDVPVSKVYEVEGYEPVYDRFFLWKEGRSIFGTLLTLKQFLSPTGDRAAFRKDKSCFHANFRGDLHLNVDQPPEELRQAEDGDDVYGIKSHHYINTPFLNIMDSEFHFVGHNLVPRSFLLPEKLPKDLDYHYSDLSAAHVTNLQLMKRDGYGVISYDLLIDFQHPELPIGYYSHCYCKGTIEWTLRRGSESLSRITSVYDLKYKFICTRIKRSWESSDVSDPDWIGRTFTVENTVDAVPCSQASSFRLPETYTDESIKQSALYFRLLDALNRYQLFIRADSVELTPAVVIACTDALQRFWNVLKDENFQTLIGVDSYLSLGSAAVETVRELIKIFRTRFSFRSAKKLVSVWADWKLKHSYQFGPDAKAIGEVVEKHDVLLQRLYGKGFFGDRTLRGSHKFDLSDYVDYPETTVTAHGKVRIRVSYDTFLSMLASLGAVNLIPTTEALWDNLPFTFVLDWFTSIGDKAKFADSLPLLLIFNVISVTTSITVESSLDTVDLGVPHFGGTMRVFRRKATDRIPDLTNSKHEMFPPPGTKDYSTLGALLWAVFSR